MGHDSEIRTGRVQTVPARSCRDHVMTARLKIDYTSQVGFKALRVRKLMAIDGCLEVR